MLLPVWFQSSIFLKQGPVLRLRCPRWDDVKNGHSKLSCPKTLHRLHSDSLLGRCRLGRKVLGLVSGCPSKELNPNRLTVCEGSNLWNVGRASGIDMHRNAVLFAKQTCRRSSSKTAIGLRRRGMQPSGNTHRTRSAGDSLKRYMV